MKPVVEFVTLAERQDLVNRVADAVHEQWGAQRARTAEQTQARFIGEVPGQLPTTQVALLNGSFAGAASLRHQDTKDYFPGATPWICNVIVLPDARGQRLATRLCEELILHAQKLGFSEVFLSTVVERDSLYHRMGFNEITRSAHDGGVVVMRLSCVSERPRHE